MSVTRDVYLVLYIEHYLQPASCGVVEYVLSSVRIHRGIVCKDPSVSKCNQLHVQHLLVFLY